MNREELKTLCRRTGVTLQAESGGGQNVWLDGARHVLVYFDESDVPAVLREVLGKVTALSEACVLVRRGESASFPEFSGAKIASLVERMVGAVPGMRGVPYDLFAVAFDGTAVVGLTHHLFDSGLSVDVSDVRSTRVLVDRLTDMGVNFEVFAGPDSA